MQMCFTVCAEERREKKAKTQVIMQVHGRLPTRAYVGTPAQYPRNYTHAGRFCISLSASSANVGSSVHDTVSSQMESVEVVVADGQEANRNLMQGIGVLVLSQTFNYIYLSLDNRLLSKKQKQSHFSGCRVKNAKKKKSHTIALGGMVLHDGQSAFLSAHQTNMEPCPQACSGMSSQHGATFQRQKTHLRGMFQNNSLTKKFCCSGDASRLTSIQTLHSSSSPKLF